MTWRAAITTLLLIILLVILLSRIRKIIGYRQINWRWSVERIVNRSCRQVV
ncbi:Uncharacterised protein [Vibrio cholerae]|nr:Uncharacterised protein [Vibrio cholerae]CSB57611.1 Uncharacterised protein [Vibrio cholerae]CSD79961.1 Uncharacterised protein [Vibrio cholerae]